MKTSRLVYLPDIHTPVEDRFTLAAVEAYLADTQPDEIVIGGDFMDFNCISSHNKGKLRLVEKQRVFNDVEYANKVLDRLQARCKNTKRWVYIQGNHEYRLNRYVDEKPELEGLLDLPRLLRFKDRGMLWVPFWENGTVHKVGKATFIHGEYHSDAHAKATVMAYGDNVFYGDVHDIQSYSKKTKGDNKTRIGQSLGCLCAYNPTYMRGRPSKWQQGFGVFHFFPDGFFNHYVVSVFKHRFVSPEGWVYDGKSLLRKVA